MLLITQPVSGEDRIHQEALVVEPFLEIHTGPGRNYPVFYIAEKGEPIRLIKRRVDWYKIRLPNGTEGWAHRLEIEKTLLASGYRKGFIDRIYDRFFVRRLEMGWGAGTFARDPMLYIRVKYILTDYLALEGSTGFGSGDLGSTELYHGGIVITPWENRWLSLHGTVGGGLVHVTPTSLLVNVTEGTFSEAHAGVGFSLPFFKSLLVRGDFRNFTLFMNPKRTREFQEYSMGLSFRF